MIYFLPITFHPFHYSFSVLSSSRQRPNNYNFTIYNFKKYGVEQKKKKGGVRSKNASKLTFWLAFSCNCFFCYKQNSQKMSLSKQCFSWKPPPLETIFRTSPRVYIILATLSSTSVLMHCLGCTSFNVAFIDAVLHKSAAAARCCRRPLASFIHRRLCCRLTPATLF